MHVSWDNAHEDGGVNFTVISSSYVENEDRTIELWTAGVLLQMHKLQMETNANNSTRAGQYYINVY